MSGGQGEIGDRGFRLDIQGLRAVAVLLVLVFHLWPEIIGGGYVGVDVFFVISGFLITGHLLSHPPRRPHDLFVFWGRRIRRLLPAALMVLVVTAVASYLIAPDTRWGATATEVIASALYVENWVLAGSSVDYLLAEHDPTPVQHYWSLSVEEQFYLFWPVLLLVVFWLVARVRLVRGSVGEERPGPRSSNGPWRPRGAPPEPPRSGLAAARAAFIAVAAGSLFLSITATSTEPASAYFVTPTRIWELALGGVVATLPSLSGLGRAGKAADPVAWIGLGMVVAAGVSFSSDTPFPGSAALLPVIGTAITIFAAAAGPWSPTRVLRIRPIQHLGDTSYSIYLWHWPLLVLWKTAVGDVTPIASIGILTATIVLATATKLVIEDPLRFAPRLQRLKATFTLAGVGMVVVCMLGSVELLAARQRIDAAAASLPGGIVSDGPLVQTDPEGDPLPPPTLEPGATPEPEPTDAPAATFSSSSCDGAAAIVRGFDVCPQDPAARMRPPPIAAQSDYSDSYRDGCWNYAPFATQRVCTYGKGTVRIALVGNSHAGQWLPALQVLAKRNHWTITTFLASQCNATDARLEFYVAAKIDGCLGYGRWVLGATGGHAFDLVVTSERQSVNTQGDNWADTAAAARAGYSTYLQRWSASGAKVLILRDTPFPGRFIPDCLAAHPTNQPACAGTPADWRSRDPLFDAARQLALPGIETLDTTDFFCTDTACPAVIGSVVVYLDKSHMTATYSRSIAPFIEAQILAALGAPAD